MGVQVCPRPGTDGGLGGRSMMASRLKPRVKFCHRAAPVVVDELEGSGVLAVVEIFLM
jgi:hypothetical protein